MGNHAFEAFFVNRGKYNEGHMEGRWVEFPCTKEKLQEALTQIGIGAEYEEYFISKYYSDTIFELNRVLGEYENVENLNYLAKRLQEFSEAETEKFNVIMENTMPNAAGAVNCINLTYNLQYSQDEYSGNIIDIPAEYRMKSEPILFSVIQHGFENHFRMEEQSLDALMRQFKSKQHPFVEMEGEAIDPVTFAGLEQSDEITLSVTADIDNDKLKVYEINGVPEGERTDDNSNIWDCGLKEYINGLETKEADSLSDKIMQATEEYIEQLTVTEEAMVMEG